MVQGKTLVKKLKKILNFIDDVKIIFLHEPVEVWESIIDKKGENIIEKYYKNQKICFSFNKLKAVSSLLKKF